MGGNSSRLWKKVIYRKSIGKRFPVSYYLSYPKTEIPMSLESFTSPSNPIFAKWFFPIHF